MGMIIYEMLALNIPYYDQNPFQVPMLIMKGVRPALPEKIRLDSNFKHIISIFHAATQMDPESRPTAMDVKDALLKLC